MFLYQVNHGNGPAFPYKYRLLAEPGLYGSLGRQHCWGVSLDEYGVGPVEIGHFDTDPGRAVGGYELSKQTVYFLGSLVWYEPHAHFCPCPCRNYRFCAFAGETAPESVDIERGPCGLALEQRVPRLSRKVGNSQIILHGTKVDGKRGHFFPFPIFHWKDIGIETRNGHRSIGILEFFENIGQCLGGIFEYAAV